MALDLSVVQARLKSHFPSLSDKSLLPYARLMLPHCQDLDTALAGLGLVTLGSLLSAPDDEGGVVPHRANAALGGLVKQVHARAQPGAARKYLLVMCSYLPNVVMLFIFLIFSYGCWTFEPIRMCGLAC